MKLIEAEAFFSFQRNAKKCTKCNEDKNDKERRIFRCLSEKKIEERAG